MKYLLLFGVCLTGFLGCTPDPVKSTPPAANSEPEPETTVTPAPASTQPAGEVQMRGTGQMFRFYESDADRSEGERPSFEITAPSFVMQDDVVIFENAEATVYAEGSPSAVFKASEAILNQGEEVATLKGTVEVEMDGQKLAMESMEWKNADRTATSEGTITYSRGETLLNAQGMTYSRDSERLELKNVTGTVRIKEGETVQQSRRKSGLISAFTTALLSLFSLVGTAHAQTQATAFTYLDIVEPAAKVIFKGGRLESIDGDAAPIQIRLRGEDESVQPMSLKAVTFGMGWPESGSTSQPSFITLDKSVEVDSAQGLIASSRARLDFAANTLTFTDGVSGSTPEINQFTADKIVYDLESGDAEMSNLKATGVPMASDGGGFSTMDINRAGTVAFTGGSVKQMSGGVSIGLAGDDGRFDLSASTVTFAWSGKGEGAKPSAVNMSGSVNVKSPDGLIKSSKATMDLKAKSIVFTDKVSGSTEQIKEFACDKMTYGLETGDTDMENFTAKNLPIESSGEKKNTYKSMDVNKAPQVALRKGQLDAMTGGVEISLVPVDESASPVLMSGDKLTFVFAEGKTSPDTAILTGNSKVDMGERWMSSDSAEFDLAEGKISFKGKVSGNLAGVNSVAGSLVVYDLNTNNLQIRNADIEELPRRGREASDESPPPGGAEPPASGDQP
ncbi:MAG: hypothetical protein AMXMBFR84_46100 [Candidatus Hydrogenedentota bacterium]